MEYWQAVLERLQACTPVPFTRFCLLFLRSPPVFFWWRPILGLAGDEMRRGLNSSRTGSPLLPSPPPLPSLRRGRQVAKARAQLREIHEGLLLSHVQQRPFQPEAAAGGEAAADAGGGIEPEEAAPWGQEEAGAEAGAGEAARAGGGWEEEEEEAEEGGGPAEEVPPGFYSPVLRHAGPGEKAEDPAEDWAQLLAARSVVLSRDAFLHKVRLFPPSGHCFSRLPILLSSVTALAADFCKISPPLLATRPRRLRRRARRLWWATRSIARCWAPRRPLPLAIFRRRRQRAPLCSRWGLRICTATIRPLSIRRICVVDAAQLGDQGRE